MKNMGKLCAGLAAAVLSLGGCASEGPTEPDFSEATRYDIEKIRQVEKEAHVRNVEIIWVNLPQGKRQLKPVQEEETTE